MRNAALAIPNRCRILQRFSSSSSRPALGAVDRLHGPLNSLNLDAFRHKAFIPEEPIFISATGDEKSISIPTQLSYSLPAAEKWFGPVPDSESRVSSQDTIFQHSYLIPFGGTILPYEYIVDHSHTSFIDRSSSSQAVGGEVQNVLEILDKLGENSSDGAFHRFNAPLSLFLHACRLKIKPRLYIAQAQIADLPKQLQDDLPIPEVVKKAGKGDIYDSNIWMGIPPTYTPLHKDPNPNLFVQLSGSKSVRIFRPAVGFSIFRKVQQSIGQASSSTFRGEEMMEGPERDALDEAVWGQSREKEGYEAIVNPGDALFIPKGWWHSFKSVDKSANVNASVNWWFR